jgi:hypothetical protein
MVSLHKNTQKKKQKNILKSTYTGIDRVVSRHCRGINLKGLLFVHLEF